MGERGRGGRARGRRAALVACFLLAACATPGLLSPDVLAPYLERVRRARGVERAPAVEVRLLAPAAVRGRIEWEMDRVVAPEQREATTALLRALGLIAPDADPWTQLLELQAHSVAGYFTAIDRRLYVVARGGGRKAAALARPAVARVLVHELAHAFQAAHSPLPDLSLGLEGFDDVAFAWSAVLEGDALWTEHRDAERSRGTPMPDAEVWARHFEIDVEAALPEGSPWLRAMFLRPYPLGYRWVSGVQDAQGDAGRARLLREPPLTSVALLHPERGLAGRDEIEAPEGAFAPDADCRTRSSSSFGAIGLEAWFDGTPRAADAAGAWRADRAWLLACPQGDVWAWLFLLRSPEAAGALEPALRERAEARLAPGVSVARNGSRVLVERGLEEAGRRWLLGRAPVRHYPDLEAWLAGHPDVRATADRIRERAPAK